MPFGRGGHAAAGGSFTILRFGEADLPDDVDHYAEVMDRLGAEALTLAATVQFLTDIARQT